MPHPSGDIDVRLARVGEHGLHAWVTLPGGLGGIFLWNGKQKALVPGRQDFEL